MTESARAFDLTRRDAWLHPPTLRCSYCGAPSLWQTARDGREYCPRHLHVAHLKMAAWARDGTDPRAVAEPRQEPGVPPHTFARRQLDRLGPLPCRADEMTAREDILYLLLAETMAALRWIAAGPREDARVHAEKKA